MNILILAVGTRNKIVQYFKRTFNGVGNVVATEAGKLEPAIYDADKYYVVPPINEIGITIIGSSYELYEMALDKMQMYEWLKSRGCKCARFWMGKKEFYRAFEDGEVFYPVFVKFYRGSASISISKVFNNETIELLFSHEDELMIQEFLNGQEIGADLYIDMISDEVVSIFTKNKIKMRAGETAKVVSFKEPALFNLVRSSFSKPDTEDRLISIFLRLMVITTLVKRILVLAVDILVRMRAV